MGLMMSGRQKYITTGPLVRQPSACEVERVIENLRRHKLRGPDQIPAELYKAWGRTIHSVINELIISFWIKNELPEDWKESIIVLIYNGDKTASIN
jgi:hypothetical protein